MQKYKKKKAVYKVDSIEKLLKLNGIDFNDQDPKVSWLPLELFDDKKYEEAPSSHYFKIIQKDDAKNERIKGFLEA